MEGLLLFATFGLGIAFAPLTLILIIVGIVLLVRGGGWSPPGSWGTPRSAGGRETGIDVLERRFAEGELSLEQYRERRAVLDEKR